MWNIRNPFKKKKKNPDKVRAGIASGEARRLKRLEKMVVDDVLDKNPELLMIRDLGKHYDMDMSDKQLICLIPYLMKVRTLLLDREPPIIYDL